MLSCYYCDHCYKNDSLGNPKNINGKWIKPFEKYCGFSGKGKLMRRIGARDLPRHHSHPAWCPLYEEKGSCLTCGNTIYAEQGITCAACRRKGL